MRYKSVPAASIAWIAGDGSYTFSHSIDSASTDAFAHYLNTRGEWCKWRSREIRTFDIRHSFTAGVPTIYPAGIGHAGHVLSDGWSWTFHLPDRLRPLTRGAFFVGAARSLSRPNVIQECLLSLTARISWRKDSQ